MQFHEDGFSDRREQVTGIIYYYHHFDWTSPNQFETFENGLKFM